MSYALRLRLSVVSSKNNIQAYALILISSVVSSKNNIMAQESQI
jgi:hypothetical protein